MKKTAASISVLHERMKAKMLFLFFVAAIFLHSKNVYGFNGNRIVNGSQTPDGEFEFLPRLTIFMQGYGFGGKLSGILCSSTIISSRHILTAAHCVDAAKPPWWNYRASLIFVTHRNVGKMALKPEELRFDTSSLQTKYYFHGSYFAGKNPTGYDIAIIEFPEGTNFGITPIILASNYSEKQGDMAIAAGYGKYKWFGSIINGTDETPAYLQNATVPVIIDPDPSAPPDLIFASTYERFADEGDSGGPLFLKRNGKYYQIGVASSVGKLRETFVINVYTRLSSYCDWITMITKGAANCEPLPDADPTPAPFGPNGTDSLVHQSPEPQNSSITFTFSALLLFIALFVYA